MIGTPTLNHEDATLAAELAARVYELNEKVKIIMGDLEEAKARLRDMLKPSEDSYDFGDLRVSVTQPHKFDPARAEQLVAPEVLQKIIKVRTEIDEGLARETLPGRVFDACRTPYGRPRVAVTAVRA